MRAAIYNPYLDTLGGGERYTFFFAKTLVDLGYHVDIEWNDGRILSKIENRFGIETKGMNIVNSINRGSGYDLCFWVSDGSIPTLSSRKNILHFQVPFTNVNGRSLINKMKLFRINYIVCNSLFTKKVIDREYGVDSLVLYPPVDVNSFKSKTKLNIILFVGRFATAMRTKGQQILVKAFKRFYDDGNKDWKLILVGGSEVGSKDLVKKLKKMGEYYPLQIVESPSFAEIKKLYGESKIFWSASGYGNDEVKNPKGVEHFGITVVEAMASGCIPLVANIGGHKEIIKDGINGYLWSGTSELVKKTEKLLADNKKIREISKKAVDDSKMFSNNVFVSKIREIIK